MTYWRQAGITYLRFSSIASEAVKACIKKDAKAAMVFPSTIKKTNWKDGKPIRVPKPGKVPFSDLIRSFVYIPTHCRHTHSTLTRWNSYLENYL
ncbi:protein stunted-like [Varroa destructor]|uniref:Uncharacterized protein n=1 Tax=Varroa destructor TaxID=109461 RepID=A0A7M7JIL7_VARDE|nr:protein stunted-like [Varroa destructor]